MERKVFDYFLSIGFLPASVDTVKKDRGPDTEQTECQAFSSVVPIAPLTRRRVLPPLVPGGHTHLPERGLGGPNSDEGTDILVLWV
jgi:hypothetical protein